MIREGTVMDQIRTTREGHPISRASMAIAAVSTIVEWYDFTLYLYIATVLSRVFFPLMSGRSGKPVMRIMQPKLGASSAAGGG